MTKTDTTDAEAVVTGRENAVLLALVAKNVGNVDDPRPEQLTKLGVNLHQLAELYSWRADNVGGAGATEAAAAAIDSLRHRGLVTWLEIPRSWVLTVEGARCARRYFQALGSIDQAAIRDEGVAALRGVDVLGFADLVEKAAAMMATSPPLGLAVEFPSEDLVLTDSAGREVVRWRPQSAEASTRRRTLAARHRVAVEDLAALLNSAPWWLVRDVLARIKGQGADG